jgi:hypothetical protein
MIIYATPKNRIVLRKTVQGAGLLDWLGTAVGKVGNFFSTNSGLIKNIANTVGEVTKAGATTASAVKQIVDLVKASKTAPQVLAKPPVENQSLPVPPALNAALNQKSIDILNQLLTPAVPPGSPAPAAHVSSEGSSASVDSTGAGFKVVSSNRTPGRGLYLKR